MHFYFLYIFIIIISFKRYIKTDSFLLYIIKIFFHQFIELVIIIEYRNEILISFRFNFSRRFYSLLRRFFYRFNIKNLPTIISFFIEIHCKKYQLNKTFLPAFFNKKFLLLDSLIY